MTPEEVDRYTRFNEAGDGPLRRLLLRFESASSFGSTAVILLNDDGLVLQNYTSALVGRRFSEKIVDPPLKAVLEISGLPSPAFEGLKPEVDQHIPAWTVLAHEATLMVAQHSVPKRVAKSAALPLAIGIVVTGKQNMRSTIVHAEMLAKTTPTPFVADKWGDSYNDAFDLEPRIIEAAPATVFTAIDAIINAGKQAFAARDYDAAATKFRKAFHYSHKYYPDSLPPEDLDRAADLKLRALLNLALAGVLAGTTVWVGRAVEAASFVLEMPEADRTAQAKAFNRRGRARLALGDDESAQSDLEQSLALQADEGTRRAIQACREHRDRRLAMLRTQMRSAFQ